jgi:hypothetical protein
VARPNPPPDTASASGDDGEGRRINPAGSKVFSTSCERLIPVHRRSAADNQMRTR